MGFIFMVILFLFVIGFVSEQQKKQAVSKFQVDGNCKCPYCPSVLTLNNGYHTCAYCNHEFLKINDKIIKAENCLSPRIEFIVKISAFLSKADGRVSQNEVNCLNRILDDLSLNTKQISLAANLFNVYKQKKYNKYELSGLKNYFRNNTTHTKSLMSAVYNISKLDGGISKEQQEIINDILAIINLSNNQDYRDKKENTSNKDNSDYKNSNSNTEDITIQCPYCYKKFIYQGNGFYICSECNERFKVVEKDTFKKEDSISFFIEYYTILIAYLSKADGKVTKEEVMFLKNVFNGWELNSKQVNICANLFNNYKNKSVDKPIIQKAAIEVLDNEMNIEIILIIIKQLVSLDGGISKCQNHIINYFLQCLNVSREYFDNLNIYEEDDDYENEESDESASDNDDSNESEFYTILGIKPNFTNNEIKKAYHKMIKIYHPDMQSSKDLPEEILKDIRTKFDNIQHAYNELRRIRNF